MRELTWIEISKGALEHNIRQFRNVIGRDVLLCACVKANAYGHGLVQASRILVDAGADWLSVNSVYEARILRQSGIRAPICILGYVSLDNVGEALELNCRMVVYNRETVEKISREAKERNSSARIHIKLETGTNRQGIRIEDIQTFLNFIRQVPNVEIEGISTHFANIEDTTDHTFAFKQIERFRQAADIFREAGIDPPVKHCANSAATILFPDTHFNMVRVGISCYGMWPSNETLVSFKQEKKGSFILKPALTWKTRVAQIKMVPQGEYIGYGCTFRTSRKTCLAVLPVGYYDGFDRGISFGHVLIHGKRAPILGRICMNIIMVDVTDIPDVCLEDEAVLIGRSGDETITAETFAGWAGTINYEITTRINDRIPRILTD